ncbi:hypothetical protein ABZV80_32315 [Streptomyces sp. NPDC005132]|uniref:hypothetical protein n=1 Tax=Streptomyces sp. NPDC005132 TaxID=3154294 RepID=UPI0033BE8711
MSDQATTEVRAAQRRIVATVNASGALCAGGLALWREADRGEWKATADEISADLVLLEVPHHVVKAFPYPRAKSRSRLPRRGEEVRVDREDLAHLVRWMPSLQQHIDQTQDLPGWGFVMFEPRRDEVAIVHLALSADWPRWSAKQAATMGLMCANCGHDLLKVDEDRSPYNIPLLETPKKRRLVCGTCCNDGLEELDRLAVRS